MQQTLMINQRPQDEYRKQQALTASPVELIIMLYDGLKKNIVLGQRAIGKNDVQKAHNYLIKAQDIVSELIKSLDMNYEVSKELMDLYQFMLENLMDANVKKDAEILNPVIDMVESLREAWREVDSKTKGSLQFGEIEEEVEA
jgi:flagellar protein FliS